MNPRIRRHRFLRSSAALFLLFNLGACTDGRDQNMAPQPPTPPPVEPSKPQANNPTVLGPISGGGGAECCIITFAGLVIDLREQGYTPGTPFYAGVTFDEAELGYLESEFFISGTASSFSATDQLQDDGRWTVEPAIGAEYTSRIVVQRPQNDALFNGTVIVEWFNVTGGLDAAPDWTQIHTELMREGYAWVGVSAQSVGIEGGGAFDLPLKLIDSERYGQLNHPGDSFSYDIFSQAAQAVRNPVGISPLGELQVQRMIGVGQSQSASRLVTYVNAIHPTIDLFDGFLIHSRGNRSSSLSQQPQADIPTPEPALLRDDLDEPVITLQAETDVLNLGSAAIRQDDSAKIRLWEVAGAAHSDVYTTIKGPIDRGDDPAVADVISNSSARPPFIECPLPVNDGPMHWLAKTAVSSLDSWIRDGQAAPMAHRLMLTEDGSAFLLDSHGNVMGGIRTPYVDAPVAVLSGLGNSIGFCGLFGTTMLFDDAKLAILYPSHQDYVNAIDEAVDTAVAAGFLLPTDAALIKTAADNSDIGAP